MENIIDKISNTLRLLGMIKRFTSSVSHKIVNYTMNVNRNINKNTKIDNETVNKTASKTMSAFEHIHTNTPKIDYHPQDKPLNLTEVISIPQIGEMIGIKHTVKATDPFGNGSGELILPKWYMRGLVMKWNKHHYKISDGTYYIDEKVIEDYNRVGRQNGFNMPAHSHDINFGVSIDTNIDAAMDTSGNPIKMVTVVDDNGVQIPSEVDKGMVDAPSLSGNIPSSTQYENLSDKTLIERIIANCNGCETKEKCFWNQMKDYDAIRRCPCGVCIIKSMCKKYCDVLLKAL